MRRRLISISLLLAVAVCFCANGFARTIAERDFHFARGLQQRGLYELAAKEYVRFITNNKGHELEEYAWLYTIECYKQMGDKKNANQVTAWYNQRFPGSHRGALLAMKTGDDLTSDADDLLEQSKQEGKEKLADRAKELYKQAAESYSAFLKSDLSSVPEDQRKSAMVTGLFKRAYCYERTEDWNDAIKDYEELAQKYADYEAQFKVGDVYLRWAKADPKTRDRTLKGALEGFRKVFWFGVRPCYDDAKIGEAEARIEYGKYLQEIMGADATEGRKELLKQVTKAREDLNADLTSGKFDKAYQAGRAEADAVDPVYLIYLAPKACILISECFEIEGDKKEAEKWLKIVTEKFPKSEFVVEAQKRLADLLDTGTRADAITTAEEAKRTLVLAVDAFQTGEYEDAFEGLMKLRAGYAGLRQDPGYKEYLKTLMDTCFASGRYIMAGVAAEQLAKMELIEASRGGKGELLGDALHLAGSAYWKCAEEMPDSNKQSKVSFQIRAVDLMEKLARMVPNHPNAAEGLLLSGSYHLDLKQYEEAAQSLATYLSRSKDTGSNNYREALYNLAYCYLSTEDYDNAANQYQRYVNLYLNKDDRVVMAINMLGVCRLREKDYDKAIAAFRELDPEKFKWIGNEKLTGEYHEVFSDALYFIARAYYDKGEMGRAAKAYEDFFAKYPDNSRVPKARLELGQLYFDEGKHEKAVEVLREFLAKSSDDEQAYLGYVMLVQSYLKTDDAENALKTESEMFAKYGKEQLPEAAYGKMAAVMKEANQPDGASMAYRELISDYKDEPEVLQRGLWAAAEYSYETLEKVESEIDALSEKAGLSDEEKARLEELKAKEAEFRTAASLYYDQYIEVAQGILKSKNEDKLPARYFEVQLRLAGLNEKLGEYEKAEKAYNAVAARSGDAGQVVEAQYRIGFMWLNAGNPKKALGSLMRIVFFPPEETEKTKKWIAYSLFEAGRAYVLNKQPEEAAKMFEDFLKKYGEDPDFAKYSAKAKELLKEIR